MPSCPIPKVIDAGPVIPAMTSEEERRCYYRLTREAAPHGAVIEFGAWLGASTAYMAAAMRDEGIDAKVHTYDKFLSKDGHIWKVKEHLEKRGLDWSKAPVGDAYNAFCNYLGPLMHWVQPHRGEIIKQQWDGSPISLIVNDAPKRIPAISAMMTNFRSGIRPDTIMAWQDFCHFPSYEIPASLYRLRHHLSFREAVYPGSTLVFDVVSVWEAGEVTHKSLGEGWTPREIDEAWDYWLKLVDPRKAGVFRCGKALFLCDQKHVGLALKALEQALSHNDRAVLKKWRYLKKRRGDLVIRYEPLFRHLQDQGVFEAEIA